MFNFNNTYKKTNHKLQEGFDFNAVQQENTDASFKTMHKDTMTLAFRDILETSLNKPVEWFEGKNGNPTYDFSTYGCVVLDKIPEIQIKTILLRDASLYFYKKSLFIGNDANIRDISEIINLCIDNRINLNIHNTTKGHLYINIASLEHLLTFQEYVNIIQEYNSIIFVYVKIDNPDDIHNLENIIISKKYPYIIIPYNNQHNSYLYPYTDMLYYIAGTDYEEYLNNDSDILLPSLKRVEKFLLAFKDFVAGNNSCSYWDRIIYNNDHTYTLLIISIALLFLTSHSYLGPDKNSITTAAKINFLIHDAKAIWNNDTIKDVAAMMLYILNNDNLNSIV